MTDTAILVQNLGKEYVIGKSQQRHDTLRDAIVASIQSPFKRLSSRNSNGHNRDGDEKIWALRNVSLEIKRGEVWGLIGRNGAGKSTFLKLLSRITEPTEGRALVYGRVGSLLEVGTGFHPELTGRENIFLNGAILGMTKIEINRKFDEIVAFAEIEKFLDMPVKRYSSGMYVRLAFAVAAHLEPEILLVDEVLAVGDAAFQKKCLGKMDDVSKEGRTILFVSHNMNAIQRLCPQSIMLSNGRLDKVGETADVVAEYLSSGAGTDRPGHWIDLSDASRQGSGEAVFKAIKYTSQASSIGGQLYANGSLVADIHIRSDSDRRIGSLAITIYDLYGTKLVNADTLALGKILQLKSGQNQLRMKIDRLHLNPGIYIMGLWLANPSGDVFDHISSALKIEVVETEMGRFGNRPKADGVVTCDFEVVEGE